VIAASLVGCSIAGSPAAAPIDPAINITAPADAWRALASGLETRRYNPGASYPFTSFVAVRIDPALYSFRAHYQPGTARTLDQWSAALPDAIAIVNANFFDANANALGLVVTDGTVYGQAYQGRGGMLQVVDGQVRVRSTVTEPYNRERLDQAVQAFPMLIAEGAVAYSDPRPDRPSRRTVIGADAQGRIVLLVTPGLTGMPLTAMSAYLASSDLGLVNAVNLDGGGSSLLAIAVPGGETVRAPSFDPVPVVLAVYAK